MARVTVEDCVDKIKNRFELVLAAAHRTRQIAAGAAPTIERDNDKNPVVALREIAEETININSLKDASVNVYRRHIEPEPEEEELEDLINKELSTVSAEDLASELQSAMGSEIEEVSSFETQLSES